MRLLPLATVFSLSTALLACNQWGSGEFCTFQMATSVTVTVVDTQGRLVEDVRVTYTVDDGPEQQAECAGIGPTPDQCPSSWRAGQEQSGGFVITATSADGKRSVQQEVEVDEDECHVISQHLRLTLPE